VAKSKRRSRRAGSPHPRRRRALERPLERVAFWLVWFATALALWMLLVFKTELAEVVAGALAAALAATGAELVRSRGYAPFAPAPRWWLGVARLPREVIVETWLVIRLLVRHFLRGERVQGRFRIVHFEGCVGDEPRDQARRALAKWQSSVSPNTYVLGFDEHRKLAVVHQLIPTEDPPEIYPST
jgi:hypothetical protein